MEEDTFRMSSVPEMIIRKMYKITVGLEVVELIADDFLIIRYRKTEKE